VSVACRCPVVPTPRHACLPELTSGCCAAFAKYPFSGEKFFNMYSAYFDKNPEWLDSFMTQAFTSSGDFAKLGSVGRSEGIQKTTTSGILVSATLHELDTAISQMAQQKYGDKDGTLPCCWAISYSC
jgi:hypothetical protein